MSASPAVEAHAALTEGVNAGVAGASAGPSALAWRRLRRNRVAMAFGAVFVAIVCLALLAPVYAKHVAHTGPNENHVTETVVRDGKRVDVVPARGVPIGPVWQSHFFLGADTNGRDLAVRLLYGARNSLEIAAAATLLTVVLGVALGMIAGYFPGRTDSIVSSGLNVIWAYPAVLLGIALGVTLAVSGINLGVVRLEGNALLVPAVIIGVVYVPYLAKPIRAQTLSLRERDFIDSARQLGIGHSRILLKEVLPNLSSTVIVFVPLIVANAILLEAGLSFLGAGVQPPNPSWGTMIADGIVLVPGAIHLALVPGFMLVLTVLSVNVFGEGVRDALDPFAPVRLER